MSPTASQSSWQFYLTSSCQPDRTHQALIPMYSDRKVHEEKHKQKGDQTESSHALSNQDGDHNKKALPDDRSSGTTSDKMSTEEFTSDSTEMQKGSRPMSPGTLALMCDEQDTMLMTSQNSGAPPRFLYDQSVTEVYAEQERCVLTEFRDCLQKLITRAKVKGNQSIPLHESHILLSISILFQSLPLS